jgi:integrative and conjugative element protein (TIGR02256 family)
MSLEPGGGRLEVRIAATAAATIRAEARHSRDGTETGGILLGATDLPHAAVRHAGLPGPAAIRQPAYFLRDLAHAQHLAAGAWTADGSVWIGDWHTHPVTPPIPSERDLRTYAQLLADPDLAFNAFVALIIGTTRPDWRALRAKAWIYRPGRIEAATIVVDPSNADATYTRETETGD